jgi:hypothetical protein
MKIREKFKALTDAALVKEMMVNSVYGTMQLEEQGVPRVRIEYLYDKVQEEKQILLSERQYSITSDLPAHFP